MASSIVIAQVKQELKHIPKGKGIQNRLRMIYNAMRRSHLAMHGDHYPPSATLKQATELLGSLSDTLPGTIKRSLRSGRGYDSSPCVSN